MQSMLLQNMALMLPISIFAKDKDTFGGGVDPWNDWGLPAETECLKRMGVWESLCVM